MFFWKSISKFFKKGKQKLKYKEIFSTTENKLNIKNTNPLEVYEENDSEFCNVKSLIQNEFYDNTRLSEFLSEEATYLYSEPSIRAGVLSLPVRRMPRRTRPKQTRVRHALPRVSILKVYSI